MAAVHSTTQVVRQRLTPARPRPTHSSLRTMIRDWWLELTACVFLLGALAATVVTIRLQQGRPLYHWPYNLTINSLISIYSTLVKAAILLVLSEGLGQLKWVWFQTARPLKNLEHFDKASRGEVIGSMTLLWKLKLRAVLSSVAAFVTLAVLLVDPFVQQITQYYSCQVLDDSVSAHLPRTNRYDYVGYSTEPGFTTLDRGMVATLAAGLSLPEIIRPATNCSTGHCSFPMPLHTLGYCSTCTDISNQIHVVNETVRNVLTPEGSEKLNLSLPSGVYYEDYDMVGGVQSFLTAKFDFPGDLSVLATYLNTRDSPADPNCKDPSDLSWSCQGAGAATCKVRPCVKTYETAINNGQLEEKLTDTYIMPYAATGMHSAVNTSCLRPSDKLALTSHGVELPADEKWMIFNKTFQGQEPLDWLQPKLNIPQDCVYSVFSDTFMSLYQGLQPLLNGSIVPGNPTELPETGDGPGPLLSMYRAGNVSFEIVNSTMNDLTEAMTTYIREHGDLDWSTPHSGLTWRSDTCVHIVWGWLALPAALTGLTILFFVAMIVQTRKGEVGNNHNWKSSTLPLLFHGLDQRTRLLEGELAHMSDMKESADQLHVMLTLTNEGWRLAPVK